MWNYLHFLTLWMCAHSCNIHIIHRWERHIFWLRSGWLAEQFSVDYTVCAPVSPVILCVCVSAQAALKQGMRAPYWRSSQRMRSCVLRGWKRMLYIPLCPATMEWWRETESSFSKWKTCWPTLICRTSWTARWEWGTVIG